MDSTRPDAPHDGAPARPGGSARRVLFLATRDVGQRSTGRILVLRTHLDALSALGHHVVVAVVSPGPPMTSGWTDRFRTVHVRSPRLHSVVLSAARAMVVGGPSLNEALFVDAAVRRRVARVIDEESIDLVVVDSLRLTGAVRGAPVTTVVDLDDLLSTRYARLRTSAQHDPDAVLGFAGARIPAPVRRPAARVATRLLGWEARRTAAREADVCARADAVTLVSQDEAVQLAARTGRRVDWLPPAVRIPDAPVAPQDGLVFLGGLDYLPNVQALRWYRDDVLPHLDPMDERLVLHVVGHCPPDVRAELAVPGIEVHGYVDDLAAALSRRMLVAPLVAGGGIKLKVLDAMAHGLPVVGTPGAFEGTALPPEVSVCRIAGPALAAEIRALADDPARCRDLGAAAREHVRSHFDLGAATRRWGDLLDRLSRG